MRAAARASPWSTRSSCSSWATGAGGKSWRGACGRSSPRSARAAGPGRDRVNDAFYRSQIFALKAQEKKPAASSAKKNIGCSLQKSRRFAAKNWTRT